MEGFLFIFLVLLFGGGGLWVLITLENRVEKYIEKEAQQKSFSSIVIRNSTRFDGKHPFEKFEVWVGGSSRIFGLSGERVFYRIVETKVEGIDQTFWVKVRTSFFMPGSIVWKEKI